MGVLKLQNYLIKTIGRIIHGFPNIAHGAVYQIFAKRFINSPKNVEFLGDNPPKGELASFTFTCLFHIWIQDFRSPKAAYWRQRIKSEFCAWFSILFDCFYNTSCTPRFHFYSAETIVFFEMRNSLCINTMYKVHFQQILFKSVPTLLWDLVTNNQTFIYFIMS